jgi:parvulin-like peptidyl-prolyl isomerase
VRAALAGGVDAAAAGDSTLLPASMSQASVTNVQNNFGNDFAEALAGVAPGGWAGPVPSAYGVHLVYVEGSTPARVPSLDEVRAAVERDVDVARREAADDAVYDALRERYTVRFDDKVSFAANAAEASAGP